MALTLPAGWIGAACNQNFLESPNGRMRTDLEVLRYVILHGTWMASDDEAMQRLCDPAAEVSAHYYIDRDGVITQMVSEDRVAFHAGKSRWHDDELGEIEGLNGWSLGVEIGNAGPFMGGVPSPEEESGGMRTDWHKVEPYTDAQYRAVINLLSDILSRYPAISPGRVLGHSDIAPGRKSDPGNHFDWVRLVAAGVCTRP